MTEVIYSKEPVRKVSRKLTRKQTLFVKELKKDPKITPTEAARRAYNASDTTARTIGYLNMHNDKILTHLNEFNTLVENTITNTISDFANSTDVKERSLAVETAKWTHDKIHGKAVQRSESTNLNISIEQLLQNLK
jgi:hypothetical protein